MTPGTFTLWAGSVRAPKPGQPVHIPGRLWLYRLDGLHGQSMQAPLLPHGKYLAPLCSP